MASAVSGLEPSTLWNNFAALSRIPRPSKQEEQVLAWLQEFAAARGLESQQDETGNIVIRRPGSAGGESAPAVVIQSHVDMVCEKNSDVEHDFTSDPISLLRDGEWLTADGTTLGADNGIGVATALALLEMEEGAKLPPLECLFTVDEETGLTGAFALDGALLQGRTMLNLDTEEWGAICIGCAGGGDSQISLPVTYEGAPGDFLSFQLAVEGLKGGHSGVDIHEYRANAIVLLASVLVPLAGMGARIVSVQGGDKTNAIPREAFATLLLPPEAMADAQIAVAGRTESLRSEYGSLEKDMRVSLVGLEDAPAECLSAEAQGNLMGLLRTLPHGALKYSHTIPGLVETSNNLASVAPVDGNYLVVCSSRSSIMEALEDIRLRIASMATMCGATTTRTGTYPGWQPNPDSPVLKRLKRIYAAQLGEEPEVGAIHAGLECGVIGERAPGMDMVSFGPTITGAHSPDERVEIPSVEKFWNLLLELLAELAEA